MKEGRYTFVILLIVLFASVVLLDFVHEQATGSVYCFGGFSYPSLLNEIVAYAPLTDTLTVKNAVLPSPTRFHSCVESSHNRKIYCFGGEDFFGTIFNSVLEYDPTVDTLVVKNAIFPIRITQLSCAELSSNKKIYCFGGSTEGRFASDKVFEYDPATDILLQKNNVVLPSPREFLSCAGSTNINKLYCFGGSYNEGQLDQILEYTPF